MNRLPCLNLFDFPHVLLAESGHGRAFGFPGQNVVLPLIEPFPQLVQLGLITNPIFFVLPITSRDLKKRTSLIKSECQCIDFESKRCMYRFPSLFAVLS